MFEELASTEHLAVVSDFDGTLAGHDTDIYAVKPHPRSIAALERLAQLPRTTVAALSGRHLDGLKRVFPLREPVLLGGSHGAESSWEPAQLDDAMRAHLATKEAELREIAQRYGAGLEIKPFQRVLHVRELEQRDPEAARQAYEEAAALDAGGFPKTVGKSIVEYSATADTKGTWIEKLRAKVGATAVVFLGDDTTDEDGFAVLHQPQDLGVKVGEGDTLAQHRVADLDGVADFLEELARARADFLAAH
ncbi:trehalose-phosphatase [Corynebacterium sp.]|uniref:trehalose-phosphatase n=1 Tax=Corynebacterium sp. TaxID=1720 RepID=UPI0026DAA324|nr:trehalose-phosphatase [Corynebacterium sp.]MDO5032409.1 trehalose-phosphatase [Corynebacterium sp.]